MKIKLCALLCVLFIGLMPMTAFATEVEPQETVAVLETEEADFIESEEEYDIDEYADYEAIDYLEQFETVVYLLQYITGILAFFVIVILCKYAYSFFNIFF